MANNGESSDSSRQSTESHMDVHNIIKTFGDDITNNIAEKLKELAKELGGRIDVVQSTVDTARAEAASRSEVIEARVAQVEGEVAALTVTVANIPSSDSSSGGGPRIITRAQGPAPGFKADKIPMVFNGDGTLHPIKFKREFLSYVQLNKVPADLCLPICLRCVQGNAEAKIEPVRDTFKSVDEVFDFLIKKYWSESKQEEARSRIYHSKYSKESGLSYADHFNQLVNLSRYLTVPVPDKTIMKKIAAHFPAFTGRVLLGATAQIDAGQLTIDGFSDWLMEIEEFEAANTRDREARAAQQGAGRGRGTHQFRANAIRRGRGRGSGVYHGDSRVGQQGSTSGQQSAAAAPPLQPQNPVPFYMNTGYVPAPFWVPGQERFPPPNMQAASAAAASAAPATRFNMSEN